MQLEITAGNAAPDALRERYFRSLSAPQVHYMEKRVEAARWLVVGPRAAPNAYMAIHDGAVVEFFAADALLPRLGEVFYAAATAGGATSAIVKSYDTLAIVAVSGQPTRMTTVGVNCTAWSDERFEPPPGFTFRRAEAADTATLVAIGPGLFETADEIPRHLAAGEITLYELDGRPLGCGIATPVREGADAYDIGVGVLPAMRGRGFGEQIIRHVKLHCLRELRVRPTCGCAVENVASRRTLENAGFLTSHRLLRFSWT